VFIAVRLVLIRIEKFLLDVVSGGVRAAVFWNCLRAPAIPVSFTYIDKFFSSFSRK